MLHVSFFDCQCSERCGFGLAKEYEDGVEFVLVGDEKEKGDCERDE
jgi:hypothetical protein